MKKSLNLSVFDLKVFTLAQQIIISSLIEEIEWLKERVDRLEQREGTIQRQGVVVRDRA